MSKNTITDLWLDPNVPATPQAITALKQADYLIFTPGSLYGSIISNFLPLGVKEALKVSKAQKILVTNLVSNRNQTHHFTPQKYLRVFRRYTGLKRPFDYLIMPKMTEKDFKKRYPSVAKAYALEHAHFLSWTPSEIAKVTNKGIKVITSDILSITSQLNRLRHDPAKLAKVFSKIIK